MTASRASKTARRITQECLAGRARLLSRAITGIFDGALRPHGVTTAQMGILALVTVKGDSAPGDVVDTLCLEKSSLSRNLDRMIQRGWIEVRAGEDNRSQRMRVTTKGRRVIERAGPAWRDAQMKARAMLGESGATALHRLGNRIIKGNAQ